MEVPLTSIRVSEVKGVQSEPKMTKRLSLKEPVLLTSWLDTLLCSQTNCGLPILLSINQLRRPKGLPPTSASSFPSSQGCIMLMGLEK